MARKFAELRQKMSPERRRRNDAETAKMLLDLNLQQLRQSIVGMNQDDLAAILRVTQGYISRLERQDDMLLSKLYAFVEALGGQVEIRARFPNQQVRITQFEDRLKAALDSGGRTKKTG